MHFIYSLVEGINDIFIDRIPRESDAEIVISASDQLDDGVLALIVDFIGTDVDVLELHILEENPALNFGSLSVCVGCLLYHVKEGHWLLWLLCCLEFFVLFNNGITSLDLS